MIELSEKCKEIEEHRLEIEQELAEPATIKDMKRYTRLQRSHRELSDVLSAFHHRERLADRLRQAKEMGNDPDPELAAMAAEEVRETEAALKEAEEKLRILLLPSDPRDAKNTVLEIRAGTGGDEAALFVHDLFAMYGYYAEKQGWKVEILSASPTDLGGFKEIFFLITGEKVYSRLKYESGIHRVQRVPATESQGRIHTSAVTVAVMPEAEEVDISIKAEELKIDVFRSSGPGGQSVNTTDSAVRITHVPTGLVVSCQDEKSQHKNKIQAMKVLRARLYDREESRRQALVAAERKQQVGSGDRSERIRTYNFPQNRLTDHRINLTLYRLEQVLEGDLDTTLDALATHYQTEALKNL